MKNKDNWEKAKDFLNTFSYHAERVLNSKEFEGVVNVLLVVVICAIIALSAFYIGVMTSYLIVSSTENGCVFNCLTFGEGDSTLCYDACIEVENGS